MHNDQNLSYDPINDNANNLSNDQSLSNNIASQSNVPVQPSNDYTVDEFVKNLLKKPNIKTLTSNLAQDVIITNKDKLKLAYDKCLLNRDSRKSWHAPASIFFTILLALLTSEFKNIFFIKKDILLGMAIMLCLVFFIVTIASWKKTQKIPKDDFENFLQEIQQQKSKP